MQNTVYLELYFQTALWDFHFCHIIKLVSAINKITKLSICFDQNIIIPSSYWADFMNKAQHMLLS